MQCSHNHVEEAYRILTTLVTLSSGQMSDSLVALDIVQRGHLTKAMHVGRGMTVRLQRQFFNPPSFLSPLLRNCIVLAKNERCVTLFLC